MEYIKKLKESGKYKLLILSYVNESHWEFIKAKDWSLNQLFDELILSYKEIMTKPYPRFYQLANDRAECKPEEIVFVDDGLNNARGAQDMGINSIKFTGLEGLIEEFKKLGISV